ncbi:MAG: hypothetical protein HFJ33_01930 [Clostridia bacterium]|nr:hypothetical protein [Clostridia bacterium]
MKNLGKKLTMLGITITNMMYATMSLAAGDYGVKPDSFELKTSNATNAVQGFGSNMISIVSTAASVFAVIILIVLGIKYMMGSAEEKAEYKKTLLPYAIGAVFVFGAGLITTIFYNIAQTDWTA